MEKFCLNKENKQITVRSLLENFANIVVQNKFNIMIFIEFIINHKRYKSGCSIPEDRNLGGSRPFGLGPVPFDSSSHKEHAGLYLEPIGSIGTKLWPMEFWFSPP